MLRIELERHELVTKFPWPSIQICTVEKSFSINNKRMSLEKLYKLATGHDIENAHRAESDVFALMECYQFLRDENLI